MLVVCNVFGTYLPLILACVVYVPTLCRRRHRITTGISPVVTKSYRTKQRLTVMLFVLTLVHAICFASVPIMNSFFPELYIKDPMARLWWRQFLSLGYLSTPVLFFAVNRGFRKGITGIFLRKLRLNSVATVTNIAGNTFH
ncbi:uncharacterized protein LOC129598121 [Paramacrobiotus metropolitanus]|uniref:uncharacterized protein LOC129598121 n=1 Tax=Paramacrobiotus metropolitanus TaxID=2943436 RepID=UPI002445DD6B|nr:uncharacterized protein LOC129598121 [Paramacrobiotus metropolitanus]